MAENFKKVTEDFECEHCGRQVKGDGYTNHCPKCLYSKHVDNHPGDRASDCEGLMEPIFLDQEHGEYSVTHKCLICGHTKRNKMQKGDDFEAVLGVIQ
ncbi:hypothetical protein CL654_01525 [bacterium]|nr:hypothetical protein [bacterium]|tara:strand:- start:6647 stop:6940 length:294 start_codon:yes stop_codon:yes gene_type:complete